MIQKEQTPTCSFVNIVTHSSIITCRSACFAVKSKAEKILKKKEIIHGGNINNWGRNFIMTAFSRQMQIQVRFGVNPSKVVSTINQNSVLSAKLVLERVAHVAIQDVWEGKALEIARKGWTWLGSKEDCHFAENIKKDIGETEIVRWYDKTLSFGIGWIFRGPTWKKIKSSWSRCSYAFT